jgi:regulator of sigma E protease
MGPQLILEFAVALIALIVLHELGHFIACRLFKVEVEEFGLGIPPRAVTLFESGGTKFTLNWFPLGGFVRPKGENDPTIPGGLAAASPWVRLVVFLAGPTMNLLAGVILFAIMYTRFGLPEPIYDHVLVSEVAPGSPADQAGLQACDQVVNVNGQTVDSTDLFHDIVYNNLGQPIQITYQRGGQLTEITLTPRPNPPEGEGAIGIVMGVALRIAPVSLREAIPMGADATINYGRLLLSLPVRLLRRDIPPEQGRVVGFKGMYDLYQQVRTTDVMTIGCTPIPQSVNVLNFFATISVSLGILNLLPIPALDGGRIFFLLPEIVLRRRIPPQYENLVNFISFTILIVLLLYINLQDFINPPQLP